MDGLNTLLELEEKLSLSASKIKMVGMDKINHKVTKVVNKINPKAIWPNQQNKMELLIHLQAQISLFLVINNHHHLVAKYSHHLMAKVIQSQVEHHLYPKDKQFRNQMPNLVVQNENDAQFVFIIFISIYFL